MANDYKNIIDGLPISDQAKNDAKTFIEQLLTNTDDFARRQGQKITLYWSEYSKGELSAEDLNECIKDIERLTSSYAAMQSVAAKQKLLAIAFSVSSVLVDGVMKELLPNS